LILAGVVFGVYQYTQRQIPLEPTEGPTPEVATPTPDQTTDWETYTNEEYGYSIKYPQEFEKRESVSLEQGTLAEVVFSFLGPTQAASGRLETELFDGLSVRVSVRDETPENLDEYAQNMRDKDAQATLDLTPEGTVSQLEKITVAQKQGWTYTVEGYGNAKVILLPGKNIIQITAGYAGSEGMVQGYLETYDLMLSTFKFLEEGIPETISIPDNWQEFTATDPDFGMKTTLSLPPGYSFRFTGSEFTIQNDVDATELWDYSTSVFRKGDIVENFYKGGSRRAWYQDYLEGKFLEEKPVLFEEGKIDGVVEHTIGSQTYLELTVSGGVNYVGEIEKHFIFVQNQTLHVIRPASYKANSAEAQIPDNIGIVFYSLKSERTE
jgi:hypothetical protein